VQKKETFALEMAVPHYAALKNVWLDGREAVRSRQVRTYRGSSCFMLTRRDLLIR